MSSGKWQKISRANTTYTTFTFILILPEPPEIRYEYNEPRGRVQVTNDTFFPTKADLLASL